VDLAVCRDPDSDARDGMPDEIAVLLLVGEAILGVDRGTSRCSVMP